MRTAIAIVICSALAACQVANPPPGPGFGGSGGSFGDRPLAEARAACREQASFERLEVRDIRSTREVYGGGGRLVGAEVVMRVRDARGAFDVRCDYSFGTRRAQLSTLGGRPGGGGGGGGGVVQPDLGEARRACRREAERQRYEFRDVLSSRAVTGGGGRVVGAEVVMRVRSRGQPLDIRCDYTFRSQTAVLSGGRPPGGGGGGGGVRPPAGGQDWTGAERQEAIRACRARAGVQGLEVRDVRDARATRFSGGQVVGGLVVMRVRRGGQVYDVRCDYGFRNGTASISRV